MAWTQELQTVEDWEDDEGRERESIFVLLSLISCRCLPADKEQGTA